MEQSNNYTIIVNLDLIFDFKAVLFCLARNFNEKYDLQKSLSQSFLNSIKFKNLNEFADCLEINDNFKIPFISFIAKNNLYSSIKPRLLFCFELYYLIKVLTNLKKNFKVLSIYDVMDKSYIEYIYDSVNEIKKLLGIDTFEIINIDKIKNIDNVFIIKIDRL